MDQSIHKWIHENRIVNEKGDPMNFVSHHFLFEPYADWSREQVFKKAAQVGVSVMMILKTAFACKNKKLNIIYTLPSDNDMYEFVPAKVDKIIQFNPAIKSVINPKTDSTSKKEIADRFVFYKGTRSKTAPIMTTADLLVHDEVDRSDQKIVSVYQSRTKFSKYKGRWLLSNPSVSKYGVDHAWRVSDQKEWVITCMKCKTPQILTWDRNVSYEKEAYVCINCGKVITTKERMMGKWVAGNPSAEVSGYHISQLMAPWIQAKELIKERETSDDDYFNNFILGEAVDAGDVERFRQYILDNWTPKALDKPPFFMGIDIGRVKHYVLGNKEGIFKIGKCESREEIEYLIEKFNPTVVMDAGPERTWAEEFRKKYPKFNMCWFKPDRDKKQLIRYGEKDDTGYVWADRNRTIDYVVNDLAQGEILFDVDGKRLEQYIKHWEAMVRIKETDKLGRDRFVWETNTPTAPDHWAFATLYYWIARKKGDRATYITGAKKKAKFITQRRDGKFYMEDIEEFMQKGHEEDV